jgi:hypothetical protein
MVGIAADTYNKPAISGPPLTGLVGWYDADDASTFTYFSGTSVRQWNDKSGSGNHATVTGDVVGNAPTRVAAAINGKAAMSFGPSGVMLTNVSASNVPFHLFAAVKTGPITGASAIFGGNGAGAISLDHNAATIRLMSYANRVVGTSTSPFTASTPTVLEASYTGALVWTHYRNGVADGTGTDASGWFSSGLKMHLGGAQSPNVSPYDGHGGEFIIYNRVLTTVERQQVESYLRTKWGTP